MRILLALCISWAVLTLPAMGETYVVRPDGTGDFPTIQTAIDAVVDGDIIELGDGVFEGDGNRDVVWMDKEIAVRSQSGDPHACILDCEGTLRRHHLGIYIEDVGSGALVEGVTIRNGVSAGGGGIGMLDSSPRIERCVFLDNQGGYGGGLLINGESYPTIRRCTFSGNYAADGGGLCI